MVSKKEVAVFSLSEIEDYNARIEFRRNTFYFYSHRNNPDEKPIILKPAGIRELINQLKIGKVVAEKEEAEIESGKNQDGEIYNALLNHVKHWDIRYVVNSYQKEVYHWLKLFAYYDVCNFTCKYIFKTFDYIKIINKPFFIRQFLVFVLLLVPPILF